MDLASDPAVLWTARLVVAAIFAGAAASKLRALPEFAGVVENFRILPGPLVRPVAYGLPPLEAAVAVGLLLDATRAPAAGAALTLLLLFAAAMAVNLWRGRRSIDCGCFASVLRQRLGWPLVARNLLLAGLALAPLSAGELGRAFVWLDLVTILGGVTTMLLAYLAFGRLVGLAPLEVAKAQGAGP